MENITEEQIVSFETAKLAKEKGFIEVLKIDETSYFYFGNTCLDTGSNDLVYSSYLERPEIYLAPTQSLLQKWLMGVCEIDVIAIPVRFTGYLEIGYYTYAVKSIQPLKNYRFDSYEKALEQGLQEALKLI